MFTCSTKQLLILVHEFTLLNYSVFAYVRYPHIVQVISTKPSSKNLYWRAPTTLTGYVEGAEGSVLNTGEITLVFYGLHRGNVDESGDIPIQRAREQGKAKAV